MEDGTIFLTSNFSPKSGNFQNWVAEGFEIDMKTSQSIKTVVMRQRSSSYTPKALLTVSLGNDSWTDAVNLSGEENTICINGISEGVFSCSGSGRYLVFVVAT